MTVTNNPVIVAHRGNGIAVNFPFTFQILPKNKDLLNVYIQDYETLVTTKTLSSAEFTAVFHATGGGTVTYNPPAGPLQSTHRIVIERNVPYLQELLLTRYGGYDGTAIMDALDKQEMQIQQLRQGLDQAVVLPYGMDVDEFGDLVAAAAGYAEDAEEAAEQAAYWAQQAAQYMADATVLYEAIEAVVPTVLRFSGTGEAVTFNLDNIHISKEITQVYINGVYQQKNTYVVDNGVLTFGEAPPDGNNNIEVMVAGTHAISVPPLNTSFIYIVGAFPTTNNFEGRTIYHTLENKLYVYNGTEYLQVGTGTSGEGGGGIPDFGFIEPVTALPETDLFNGRAVYNTITAKLYVYVGNVWTVVFTNSGDTGGGVENPTLPEGASYYYIYPELPAEGLFEGQIAYQELDGRLYIWDGTQWKPMVDSEDVNFPEGFTGVQIVVSLPSTGNFIGRIVYLNTDGKLYRYTATGWTRETAATDIAGQITSTQISDGAISTPKLAAASIVASKIQAGAVTSDAILTGAILSAKIASGAITTDHLGAGVVTADKIQAGAITAAKINVTSLSAISATLGAVNISNAIIGTLTVDTLNIANNAVTVQAGAETAGGVSIGASYNQMQTVTVSWGSSASVWVFCQFKANSGDGLEIDIRSGGSSLTGGKSFSPKADGFSHYIDMFPSGAVSGAGISFWLRRQSAGSTTINTRKLLVLAAKR